MTNRIGTTSIAERGTAAAGARRRGGFTLIELLVVITIILIVSAVALPTVIPALSHRQVSEGARVLQSAIAGARDAAIRDNSPAGIRLLPDPAFPIKYTTVTLPNGNSQYQVDGSQPLVFNRIIPIAPAPNYTTGAVAIWETNGSGYSTLPDLIFGATTVPYSSVLVLEEVPNPLLYEPTSWFWNIRVGDKVQLNNSGPWYTVVGPMEVGPAGGNSELFVNASTTFPTRIFGTGASATTVTLSWDFLYLVNGRDDNVDGYIDNYWDNVTSTFETEQWLGPVTTGTAIPTYTIERRAAPTINAREYQLPSNVVIDATTWDWPYAAAATKTTPAQYPTLERSRLPVNPFSGMVEFLVYPNGSVVPGTTYSSPSSFGMSQAFYHFWVAERSDVYAPAANSVSGNYPPFLPLPQGIAPGAFSGIEIKGEYRLVTLFTRTGQVTTNETVPFDPNAPNSIGTASYNYVYPFLQAQQGISGGQQ
jgi:prepilin-type N-terminal cleavage/methylation domain-containing protein